MFAAATLARAGSNSMLVRRAAGLAQAEAHPDRAVAERAADLERALRAARRDHDAKEPAVFLGDAAAARCRRP